MKPTKITGRNIMFTEPAPQWGCDLNIGLILGAEHNFIIDTGNGSGSVAPVLEYIGTDTKPIVVINTHHDWDHAAGNWVFENSMIIAHKLCYELMDKHWDDMIRWAVEHKCYFMGETRKCLPNLLFENTMQFPEDGIIIFHSPGHTVDGISVYDTVDKVLYTGDCFGVVDGVAQYWGAKEDAAGFRLMLETYKQYDFEICVSGHSEPQTREVILLLEAALAQISSPIE